MRDDRSLRGVRKRFGRVGICHAQTNGQNEVNIEILQQNLDANLCEEAFGAFPKSKTFHHLQGSFSEPLLSFIISEESHIHRFNQYLWHGQFRLLLLQLQPNMQKEVKSIDESWTGDMRTHEITSHCDSIQLGRQI